RGQAGQRSVINFGTNEVQTQLGEIHRVYVGTMKRRDALKAFTAAGSGLLLGFDGKPAIAAAGDFAAKPIRALARRNGQLCQPIHLSMPSPIPGDAVAKVDGTAYPHLPLPGTQTQIEILVPRVQAERKTAITIERVGAGASSATVTLRPVREVLIYVLPHSHHDLGYTELQAK